MKPDFQQIADEYGERLETLSEYETYNDNMKTYLSNNIEIYARLFQCWFNEINPSYSFSKMEYVDESEKLAYELYKELNLSTSARVKLLDIQNVSLLLQQGG